MNLRALRERDPGSRALIGYAEAGRVLSGLQTLDTSAAWDALVDPATPNETSREIAFSIFRFGQEDVLEPYLEKFLTASETLVDVLGFHKASTILEYGFPRPLGSEATLARLDEWLADNTAPKQAQRYVGEARADIARALTAQRFDAR